MMAATPVRLLLPNPISVKFEGSEDTLTISEAVPQQYTFFQANLLDCLSALDFLNWADRNKAVEEGKKERQEQRAENIANYRGKRKGAKGKADAQHKTD
ncbi:unnamed protein product [Vitrella brassicaformis CCMP3155]|uniref:Uncharacterized protein n=1 Tax=Vitrella brassicaformis (strain CCMP3155) TaxID=1169540 RepID=A0A0G4FPL3_VITBC|nr:unnamed protein product [Vitrella brassicaformis CCMP3155]|eukprot:CEM15948.1 unnamed protein product [Vitrella brassicaformis CCMP3155]